MGYFLASFANVCLCVNEDGSVICDFLSRNYVKANYYYGNMRSHKLKQFLKVGK